MDTRGNLGDGKFNVKNVCKSRVKKRNNKETESMKSLTVEVGCRRK